MQRHNYELHSVGNNNAGVGKRPGRDDIVVHEEFSVEYHSATKTNLETTKGGDSTENILAPEHTVPWAASE